ncbi:hypothetical protein DPMN_153147 [Dreissena polymorpha]|uniref:Uncharacterized protein n=1 Tax=Dreissena polymorpha TaxID=45954 RepID=A0A9D4J930_DREPO|nr:hypothetical protein DPMN_153147 [Dreissena polymorpha]
MYFIAVIEPHEQHSIFFAQANTTRRMSGTKSCQYLFTFRVKLHDFVRSTTTD